MKPHYNWTHFTMCSSGSRKRLERFRIDIVNFASSSHVNRMRMSSGNPIEKSQGWTTCRAAVRHGYYRAYSLVVSAMNMVADCRINLESQLRVLHCSVNARTTLSCNILLIDTEFSLYLCYQIMAHERSLKGRLHSIYRRESSDIN